MMDTTSHDREIVKQVIQRYALLRQFHGDVRLDTVFNDKLLHLNDTIRHKSV